MTTRKAHLYLTLLCLAATFALSCSTKQAVRPVDAISQYEKAKARYDARRYLEAAEQFKILLAQFPGSKYAEPATFFLGKSHYEEREYPLAQVEFERIIKEFPRGSYAEESAFMLGMCAYKERRSAPYDQTQTESAVTLLETYVDSYPDGAFVAKARQKIQECRSILAHKLYLNGQLYIKLGDFGAARSCFEELREKYGDSSWAGLAILGIADSYERQKDWQKARETYEIAAGQETNTELAKRAQSRLEKLRGKTTKQVTQSP